MHQLKWWPNSREKGLRIGIWALSLASLVIVCVLLGCAFEPKFDTPIATVETYVWAYNHNDNDLMKQCGYDADLYKLFRIRTDIGVGEPIYETVHDIRMEVLCQPDSLLSILCGSNASQALYAFKYS